MINIPIRAKNLTTKYGTNNPFKLCKYLKIVLIYRDLGNIKGYSIKKLRRKLICINENLSDYDKKIVCAHELGHCILHQLDDINFMLHYTSLLKVSNLEKEANLFAVTLLGEDEEYINTSSINFEILEEMKKLK